MELKAYCENNGTRTIPADVLTESGTQLKRWYDFNKMKYRKSELSDDKVDFLRSNDMLYLFERKIKKKQRPSQLRVKLSDAYYDKLMKIMEIHDFSKEEAIERLIDYFENKPDT